MSSFRTLVAGIVLSIFWAGPINAAIISYAGYTHDEATNLVVGGGLEWLQWDETVGLTAYQAVNAYSSDGWSLATNDQVGDLFNAFGFGGIIWHNDENEWQWADTGSDGGHVELADDPERAFVSMFGNTEKENINNTYGDPDNLQFSGAFFGGDEDGDVYINRAHVLDDWLFCNYGGVDCIDQRGEAYKSNDSWKYFIDTDPYYGVALVRRVTDVPEPTSFALMGLGLAGLGISRRKRKQT